MIAAIELLCPAPGCHSVAVLLCNPELVSQDAARIIFESARIGRLFPSHCLQCDKDAIDYKVIGVRDCTWADVPDIHETAAMRENPNPPLIIVSRPAAIPPGAVSCIIVAPEITFIRHDTPEAGN